jgi:DNA-binding response OmpR family regulator
MTRILSLDDELGMLDLLGLILERAGCEHLRTTSVYEAWAILHSEPIDLLTQDLSRPDMDGWRFLHLIRADKLLRAMPVIVITARVIQEHDLHTPAPLADAYLNKPFGPKDLLATIEMVLTRHGRPLPKVTHKLHKPPPGNDKAPTVQDWLDGVQSDDWKRRWKAALALGRSQDALAAGLLMALLQDENNTVRMIAAYTLGELCDPRAIQPLKRAQSDKDAWVRLAAAESIRKMGERPRRFPLWARIAQRFTAFPKNKPTSHELVG